MKPTHIHYILCNVGKRESSWNTFPFPIWAVNAKSASLASCLQPWYSSCYATLKDLSVPENWLRENGSCCATLRILKNYTLCSESVMCTYCRLPLASPLVPLVSSSHDSSVWISGGMDEGEWMMRGGRQSEGVLVPVGEICLQGFLPECVQFIFSHQLLFALINKKITFGFIY